MHGYGREFDTQQSNCAVNLGYFKDGKPFVGRFEKFEMDEMELSSSHDTPSKQKESEPQKIVEIKTITPNDIEFSIRGSIVSQ